MFNYNDLSDQNFDNKSNLFNNQNYVCSQSLESQWLLEYIDCIDAYEEHYLRNISLMFKCCLGLFVIILVFMVFYRLFFNSGNTYLIISFTTLAYASFYFFGRISDRNVYWLSRRKRKYWVLLLHPISNSKQVYKK